MMPPTISRKKKKKNLVYLDYAASTPVDPAVEDAMEPYFGERFGNPSCVHSLGQEARAAIDETRQTVADFLGCEASEIVFTGSATEANNLALQGVMRYLTSRFASQSSKPHLKSQNFHIITSSIEHDSVLQVCKALEREGVEVTYLPVSREGFVRPQDLRDALRENTVLVSIMYVNNEIGTIQPISEIADILRDFRNRNPKLQITNSKQIPNSKFQFPIFHTDAVQAVNYLDCNVERLGVDLLTMSGHKIYGPKGVAALYVRRGMPLAPLLHGGGQEFGLRSGTENVAAIVGLGVALAQVKKQGAAPRGSSTQKLRDMLIDGVLKAVPYAKLNGSRENRIPNNANFCFPGVDAETLVVALDLEGIAVSAGAACSTGAVRPSHVLLALGLSQEHARSSLRVTLGKYTTAKEINTFLRILPAVIKRL